MTAFGDRETEPCPAPSEEPEPPAIRRLEPLALDVDWADGVEPNHDRETMPP